MKPNYLSEFCVVAESGTVKAAAKKLGISPATLSRHMENMQADMGVPLLEDDGARLMLTRAGASFLKDAPFLVQRYNELLQRVADIRETEQHRMRIGYMREATRPVLKPLIRWFETKAPHMQLGFSMGEMHHLQRQLVRHRTDAIIAMDVDPRFRAECETAVLYEEGLVVAMNKANPLSARSVLSMADLKGERIYYPEPDVVPDIYDHLVSRLDRGAARKAGAEALRDSESNFHLIEELGGISIVAAHNAIGRKANLAFVPVAEPDQMSVRISLMWLKSDDENTLFREKSRCLRRSAEYVAKHVRKVW